MNVVDLSLLLMNPMNAAADPRWLRAKRGAKNCPFEKRSDWISLAALQGNC
jgi:hypothetical protein